MLFNLAVGTGLVALTVVIHTVALWALGRATPPIVAYFALHRHNVGRTITMLTTVLGLFMIHTIEIWLWAIAFQFAQVVKRFADALYLSTAMFATVGYTEITIAPFWRLLTSFEALDGFILIGWSTAYLVGVSTRHGPFRKDEHF